MNKGSILITKSNFQQNKTFKFWSWLQNSLTLDNDNALDEHGLFMKRESLFGKILIAIF